MIFSTQIKTFGLDISDPSLKIAQIIPKGHDLQLATYRKIDLPDGILENGEIKNEEALIQSIKKIINDCSPKIEQNYVVACLPEVKTFIKLINIKINPNKHPLTKEIKEKIKKELPKHIPLPIDDICFDWQIIGRKEGNLEILIGIAPKKTVSDFSQLLKKCGLIPIALEVEAQSIIRAIFHRRNYYLKKPLLLKQISFRQILKTIKKVSEKEVVTIGPVYDYPLPDEDELNKIQTVYFIIDCGASRSGLIVWTDGTIKFSSSLKTCGNNFTETLSQKMKIETEKAEELKTTYGLTAKKNKFQIKKLLEPMIDEFCQEITRAKDFYQKNFSGDNKKYEIVLTGGTANLSGLNLELSQRLDMKVNAANPLTNFSTQQKIGLNQKEAQAYATAIGLALRSFFIKDF